MNVIKKGLIGLSLVAMLAGCSPGTKINATATGPNKNSPTAGAAPNKVGTNSQANGQKADPMPGQLASAAGETDHELLSTVDVKLTNGRVKISQPQAGAGALDFNVRNETKLPLNVSIVQTTLEPSQLMVKAGKIDAAQSGVKTVAELRTDPIEGGQQETMTKTLPPGDYQVVATAVGEKMPVAHAPLFLRAL